MIKFINTANDAYTRYAGMAIDEPLEPNFWNVRQDQILQTVMGNIEIIRTVDLSEGLHTIEVGVSAHPDTPWEVEIYANDVLINTGTSNWGAFVSGTLNVVATETEEGEEETIVSPAPAFKLIDKLRNLWQKFISRIGEEQSAEAPRR